jgi:plasmid stabilization system protein ParE
MRFEDAIEDLHALHQYIAQDDSIAANKTAKKILTTLELLLIQPEIGRPGRVLNTRELIILFPKFFTALCNGQNNFKENF